MPPFSGSFIHLHDLRHPDNLQNTLRLQGWETAEVPSRTAEKDPEHAQKEQYELNPEKTDVLRI